MIHPGLSGIAALAVLSLLLAGGHGTVVGALLALGEARMAPPAVLAFALLVRAHGAVALPMAGLWAGLGAVLAALAGMALGLRSEGGWLPAEESPPWQVAVEIAWLAAFALAAWGGRTDWVRGAVIAAVVATTRLGEYGMALTAIFLEEALQGTLLLRLAIGAGFVAGLIVVILAGWALAALASLPRRILAGGRILALVAGVAALARLAML